MYRLQGPAFEERFRIKATNVRRALLEEFIRAPLSDVDDNLETQGRFLVIAQKQIAAGANLTEEQAEDFASRMDNVVADAIVLIRHCLKDFTDRNNPQFQLEAARRLDIPVA
jgi:hypothetical protein